MKKPAPTAAEKLSEARITHGYLCVALLALNAAGSRLADHPRAARHVNAMARRLGSIVPDFTTFDALARKPKTAHDIP